MTYQGKITTQDILIDADALKSALPLLRHAWQRRVKIPILEAALIEGKAGADTATITTTDLDLRIAVTVSAEVTNDFRHAIPLRTIAALANAGEGTIAMGARDDAMDVRAGPITGEVHTIYPAYDFPALTGAAELKNSATLTIAEPQLHRLLRLSRHCISREETRYYINGVYLCAAPDTGNLRAVTTDGHRMAVIDDPEPWPKRWAPAIVPAKTVEALLSLCNPKGNTPVEIALTERWLRTRRDGVTIWSKLIDGTYPDYTRVIPQTEPTSRAALNLAGLRAMNAMRESSGTAIVARVDPAAGEISNRTKTGSFSMPMQGAGETPIGFNMNYLLAQARVTPEFSLAWAGSDAPATIRAGGDIETPEAHALWVLMPMRV